MGGGGATRGARRMGGKLGVAVRAWGLTIRKVNIPLMVQKSSDSPVEGTVVEIPLFVYKVLAPSQVVQDFLDINSST